MKICLLVITGFEESFRKMDDMRREQCKKYNIPVLFLYNSDTMPPGFRLREDERLLPIKEHVPGQFIKFHLGTREIFEKGWEFDYLIRCTSACFVDFNKLPLLLSYLPKEKCHAGRFIWNEFGVYMSGPCMIFSRDVAKKFSEMPGYHPKVFSHSDDVMIGKEVRDYANFCDLNFFWTDLEGKTEMPTVEKMPKMREHHVIFRVKNYSWNLEKPPISREMGQAIDVRYWELLSMLTGCGPKVKPFVFFSLFGGLGNQLFQYAAAYTVAKLTNSQLLLENCTHNPHNVKNINYVKRMLKDASESFTVPTGCNLFNQGPSPFAPWDPTAVVPPCRMDGYYQYLPAIQQVLPELIEKFSEALNIKERTSTVLLHVRRGDYVGKSHFHFLQGPEYYHKAYMELTQRLGYTPGKVLVFSDEIEWCKQQEWITMIPNVSFYENEDELETLAEMAKCGGGAIIGNSTFSWWGAMLSKTQVVYYPSRWIGCEVFDLFPKNWVRI